jgi:type I restriction enzyme S subunit
MLPANTNQALAIIRLKPNPDLLSKFVLKALETGVVLEQIEQFKGGVAQQNLSLAQVRDFQIAQPPIAEQQQIVAKLDALAAETQRLAGLYEQKLAALAALKKSLLHQAFSGAL